LTMVLRRRLHLDSAAGNTAQHARPKADTAPVAAAA
jgi:hypothetical protein